VAHVAFVLLYGYPVLQVVESKQPTG